MKHSFLLTLIAALFSLSPTHATEIAGLTQIVRKHLPKNEQGSLALLVTRNQKIIHAKGYGFIDKDKPMTPGTRVSLASIAKQFTAMCAALLIEDGKLKLTDKVSQHLPNLKLQIKGRELLVQDLIWHINGLPNFTDSGERALIKEYRKEHGLKYFNNLTHADWLATRPPRRAPGLQYQYNNCGYCLLARVIEAASGKSYREFQQERILDKLGMKNTESVAAMNGAGNMETTLNDYSKWDRALWNQTLLNDKTSALLFKHGKLDNGTPVNYGFGWVLEPDKKVPHLVSHTGGGSRKGNARNLVLRDLTNEITIAFFIRDNLKFTRELRHQIKNELHRFILEMDQ